MKPGLSGAKPDDFLRFSRRDALRIFAAHMALAVAGCSKPVEEIVPYVQMPQGLVPGEPLRFATAIPMAGYGLGIMATGKVPARWAKHEHPRWYERVTRSAPPSR